MNGFLNPQPYNKIMNLSEAYKNKLMRLSGIKSDTLLESARTEFLKKDFTERAGKKFDRFVKFYSKGIWDAEKEKDNFIKNFIKDTAFKNGKLIPKDIWIQLILKRFDKLEQSDPSENKQYLNWIMNIYLNGELEEEDFYKIPEALRLFDKNKEKLDVNQRNINSFNDLSSLYNVVSKYDSEEEMSASEKEKLIKLEGAEQVYNDDNWKIIIPKTQQAACLYGKSTKWCTASNDYNNRFEYYHKQGPLFILINKNVKNDKAVLKKLQFHFETGQFMDTTDKRINVTQFFRENPELLKFFTKIGQIDASFKIDNKLVTKEEGLEILKSLPEKISLINKKGYLFFEEFFKEMGATEELKNVILTDVEFIKSIFLKNNFDDLINSYITLNLKKEGLNVIKSLPWLNEWLSDKNTSYENIQKFIIDLVSLGPEGRKFAFKLMEVHGVIWNTLLDKHRFAQYINILLVRSTFGAPGIELAKAILKNEALLSNLKKRGVADNTIKLINTFVDKINESKEVEFYLNVLN